MQDRPKARAGRTYLRLDDVAFAYLCDPKIRDTARERDDPDKLPGTYAATMTIAMHTCRGDHLKRRIDQAAKYVPEVAKDVWRS